MPALTIHGYASVVDSPSPNHQGFVEIIDPGAFDGADFSDLAVLYNHDPSRVLARFSNGTVRLRVTPLGLQYEADLVDSQEARDLYALVERGDVHQSSFAFFMGSKGDEWSEVDDVPLRRIKSFRKVDDVSPVTWPYYPAATSAAGKWGPAPAGTRNVDPKLGKLPPRRPGARSRGLSASYGEMWAASAAGRSIEGYRALPAMPSKLVGKVATVGTREVRGSDPYLDEDGKLYRVGDVRGAYRSLAAAKGCTPEEVEALALAGRLIEVVRRPDCREHVERRADLIADGSLDVDRAFEEIVGGGE